MKKTTGHFALSQHIEGFFKSLLQQGYSKENMSHRSKIILELDHWLLQHRLKVDSLDEKLVCKFIAYKKIKYKLGGDDIAVLNRFITYLRSNDFIPKKIPKTVAIGTSESYVSSFVQYLEEEIGLSTSTILMYSRSARYFLQWRFKSKKPDLLKVTFQDITKFLTAHVHDKCSKSIANTATNLRSFFAFLYHKGMINLDLASAMLSVGVWDQKSIPEHLSEEEVEKLLDSCDRKSALGVRNFAILMLLVRLGIRVGELANLTLDDLDWANSEITIRGKSSFIRRLPITNEVGKALVAYLKKGRPHCESRFVFICSQPPLRGLKGPSTVSTIVEVALKRAGIATRKKGAHLLRHTFATHLLRHGSSMQEVGQVLGHRSINTTAVYAKVDFQKLNLVSIPWPLNFKNGGIL